MTSPMLEINFGSSTKSTSVLSLGNESWELAKQSYESKIKLFPHAFLHPVHPDKALKIFVNFFLNLLFGEFWLTTLHILL